MLILLERKFEEKHYIWRAKRYKVYSRKRYFGIIVFSCLSSTQLCLRFLLICFDREIKGFGQSSLGNQFDFRDIMNVSPYILAKIKFQKTETLFCCWKGADNGDINIFLSLKNPCTFLLAKEKTWKRIFNTNSELSQNRTEKQIMPFKTALMIYDVI